MNMHAEKVENHSGSSHETAGDVAVIELVGAIVNQVKAVSPLLRQFLYTTLIAHDAEKKQRHRDMRLQK